MQNVCEGHRKVCMAPNAYSKVHPSSVVGSAVIYRCHFSLYLHDDEDDGGDDGRDGDESFSLSQQCLLG